MRPKSILHRPVQRDQLLELKKTAMANAAALNETIQKVRARGFCTFKMQAYPAVMPPVCQAGGTPARPHMELLDPKPS